MIARYTRGIMYLIILILLAGAISAQEYGNPLRHRSLEQETLVTPEQAMQGYYIVEVDFPVQETTYRRITKVTRLEGFLYPHYYIIKADARILQFLQTGGLIHRIWQYTHPENYDHSIEFKERIEVLVSFFSSADQTKILNTLAPSVQIREQQGNNVRMEITPEEITRIAQREGVAWIGSVSQHEIVNDAALKITGVEAERERVHIYGAGETIAIADTGLDRGVNDVTMHNDFQGRITTILNAAGCPSCSTHPDDKNGHGTHVAGIAIGNGILSGSNPSMNSYAGSYAGVAPQASLVFQAIGDDAGSNFVYPPALISGLFQPAYNQGARVHSNSWGVNAPSTFGAYQAQARDIDKFIWDNKDMNIVYAVGNWAYQNGAYSNDTIATHAVAKNVIAVGASENYKPFIAESSTVADNPNQLLLSSGRGPTDDGRIKPDIVAPGTEIFSTRSRIAPAFPSGMCTKNQSITPGLYTLGPHYATCTGTSMATPHIAGIVALLREYYRTQEGINPTSALIKATIINSAVDMGYGTPSTATGWGRVNISKLLPSATTELFFRDETAGISTGQSATCTFTNVATTLPFKTTLVWSDPAAVLGSTKNLVNDLDLVITDPTGTIYYGNDIVAPYDSTRDNTNNVEQVIINTPLAGEYTFTIEGANVPLPKQPYALVITYEKQQLTGSTQQAPFICRA